jgi:tryptophanyl-tRNA synthetase
MPLQIGVMSVMSMLGSVSRLPVCMRPLATATFARHNSVRTSVRARMSADALVDTEEASATEATSEPAVRKRVLSGVQPTGALHLGNYLGAIRQWVANQELYDNYFCVVDLHATTAPHVPKELTKDTYRTAALYLASGIDPKRSRIFVQSHVTAHAELQWLLNCATPMGWLEKMIQYKEKAQKQDAERVSVGLFDYPVLMAADILLYQTQLVPVGEDQRQHLELTRDIARRFNDQYCKNKQRKTFVEPDALIVKSNARVMSLQDGTAKMSKSAENDMSRINLLDPPDEIARKIKRCKTDSVRGLSYDPARPEATNLLGIYEAMTGKTSEEVAAEIATLGGWGDFKPLLTEATIAHLEPLQKRYYEIVGETEYLTSVLREGQEAADEVASKTLASAKRSMGFTLPGDTKLPKLL